MDSWLLKLLSRGMKIAKISKIKGQATSNHKTNRKLKNNSKIKATGNVTPNMDPLSQKWIDGRYRSLI